MENQDLLTYVTAVIGLTGVFLPISIVYIKRHNLKKLQKDTKKLQEEYKNNLEKIEKEFAKKKAELENTVREYDERFATVHQIVTELSVLTDATKKYTQEHIIARKNLEIFKNRLKEQIKN